MGRGERERKKGKESHVMKRKGGGEEKEQEEQEEEAAGEALYLPSVFPPLYPIPRCS